MSVLYLYIYKAMFKLDIHTFGTFGIFFKNL